MKNINAIVVPKYVGSDILKFTNVQLSDLKSTEVLIKIKAASVNFADIKMRAGNYHSAKAPPFVPGSDCSGIVEAVGTNVKTLKIGQPVLSIPNTGSYAEYVKAEEVLTH